MSFNVVDYVKSLPKIDLSARIPKEEFEERNERTRAELKKRGVDVGFAYGNELRPGDTGWLTGYDPSLENTALVIGAKKTVQIVGPEGRAYAEEMAPVGELRNVLEFKIADEDYPGYEFTELNEICREAAGGSVKRIGLLTSSDLLPYGLLDLIKEKTGAEVVDISDFLVDARYHKSENELELFRTAGKITCVGMDVMLKAIRPGMRELEVAAYADYAMKAVGATNIGFQTIVASGIRTRTVIGRATNKVIEEGDMVMLDCSARFEGLSSEVGRTVVAGGRPNDSQLALLEIGTKAFYLSLAELKYDNDASRVDPACRNYLKEFDLHNMYSAVHGTGWTECQEGTGAATQYSTYKFPKRIAMMLTIGIHNIPFRDIPADYVGFRCENSFLINGKGETEHLTKQIPDEAWKLVSSG